MANTNQTAVAGQEVAIQSGYGRGTVYFGYKIARVTPKGQVVIEIPAMGTIAARERRFDADGYEMGSSAGKFNRDRLVFDVAAARANAEREKRSALAAGLLNDINADRVRSTYSKESMLKVVADLEAQLAAARAAVEAI